MKEPNRRKWLRGIAVVAGGRALAAAPDAVDASIAQATAAVDELAVFAGSVLLLFGAISALVIAYGWFFRVATDAPMDDEEEDDL